jgi:hemoglobin
MAESLYQRLGGRRGIAEIASRAVDNHRKNPLVAPRFRDSDVARLEEVATLFFCAGSGGPEAYPGKDMRSAHQGMNISEQEYLAVMDDVVEAMTACRVGPAEQAEVIAILFSLRGEVIRL